MQDLQDTHRRTPGRRRLPEVLLRSAQGILGWRLAAPLPTPSPEASLRIGVTGNLEIDAAANLADRSAELMAQIKSAAPDCKLHFLSSFAAGADQVVALCAKDQGYQLHAVLPTNQPAFAEDVRRNSGSHGNPKTTSKFTDRRQLFGGDRAVETFQRLMELSGSVLEVSNVENPSNEQYTAAALALLSNVDILIAVVPANSLHGVSADVIRVALRAEVPVIWLPSDSNEPPQIWTRAACPATSEAIAQLIQSQVASAALSTQPRTIVARLMEWFEERYSRTFDPSYNERQWRESWPTPEMMESLTLYGAFREVERHFKDLAVWADYKAAIYGSLFRGSFVCNATLGVIAVALALVGLIDHHWGSYAKCAELATLLAMSAIYTIARKRQWRARWLNYRALYQKTHHQAWRFMFGENRTRAREYEFGRTTLSRALRALLDATVRAAGSPSSNARTKYLESMRQLLLTGLLDRQQRYFSSESKDHLELHRRYENRVTFCVWLAILATAGYVLATVFHWEDVLEAVRAPVTIAGSLLPATAAALVAVSAFEEHAQLANRYREMTELLKSIRGDITALGVATAFAAPPRELSRDTLGEALDQVIKVADEELTHWSLVLSDKDLDRF